MSITTPQLALAAVSVTLVTFVVVVDLKSTSPGPLSTVHTGVDGLSESTCELCHGAGDVTLAAACNECHTEIAKSITGRSGFHGTLDGVEDCGHCHVEHFGEELLLVSDRIFALSGVDSREDYEHAEFSFSLTGRHTQLTCEECHPNAEVKALGEGQKRYLGASQQCASCHEDPHEGRMRESCESCHGQDNPFADLDAFRHTENFPLEGVHGQTKCAECHKPKGPYAVEKLGMQDSPASRACANCHLSPHSEQFIRDVAAALKVPVPASCSSCHPLDASHPTFNEYALSNMVDLHSCSGFALTPPHDQTECSSCHSEEREELRLPKECAACHENPHEDQFDEGPFASFECLACHVQEHFVPATFGVTEHALTAFPLTEGHSTAGCESCHHVAPGVSFGEANFTSVARQCEGCHEDAHEGQLIAQADTTSAVEGCAICHVTTSFSDAAGESFEHSTWTGFALDGAHADAACETCHRRSTTRDSLGRNFGRVADIFGSPPDACATCHINVHVGKMAEVNSPCADCHDTTGFGTVDTALFDHNLATGYALVGAHSRAECLVCHAPRENADENGRLFGLATETHKNGIENCRDCHEDPHGDRFRELRSTLFPKNHVSCDRCHDQESFQEGARERFDHGLWTSFPLDTGHSGLECGDCHVTSTSDSFGKARGKNCAACHDDPHVGQFGSSAESRCERCHESTEAFATLVFDHERDSAFLIDEEHQKLPCSACHKPWPLRGGGEAVRYKPLGKECADCHLGVKKW